MEATFVTARKYLQNSDMIYCVIPTTFVNFISAQMCPGVGENSADFVIELPHEIVGRLLDWIDRAVFWERLRLGTFGQDFWMGVPPRLSVACRNIVNF